MDILIESLLILISFVILYDTVFSQKMTWIYSLGVLGACLLTLSVLIQKGLLPLHSVEIGITAAAFVMFWVPAKYKGFPYIFTICTVNVCSMMIILSSMMAAKLLGVDQEYHCLLAVPVFAVLWFAEYKVRRVYHETIYRLKKGWMSLTVMSVLIYGFVSMILYYSDLITSDARYFLIYIYLFVIITAVHVIIFQQIWSLKENYEYEQNKRVMELELKLKNSQIKERELYYKMAYEDVMTGLQNRTAMEKRKAEFQEDWENQQPFACISVDLNNLKETNDNFGHNEGDFLICSMGKILNEVFEPEFASYRTGGDEFLVFCPHTDEKRALALLHKLYVFTERFNHSHQGRPVSFAAGLAVCDDWKKQSLDDILGLADQKMYCDKRECHARLGIEPKSRLAVKAASGRDV